MVIRTAIIGFGALLISSCASLTADPPGGLSDPKIERLSDTLLMVPVARDKRGCVLYRVTSPYRRGDTAIYWRVGEGHFTTDPTAVRCA